VKTERKRLDCGHLETTRSYFERDAQGEMTGKVMCSRCYAKVDSWLNTIIKVKDETTKEVCPCVK